MAATASATSLPATAGASGEPSSTTGAAETLAESTSARLATQPSGNGAPAPPQVTARRGKRPEKGGLPILLPPDRRDRSGRRVPARRPGGGLRTTAAGSRQVGIGHVRLASQALGLRDGAGA